MIKVLLTLLLIPVLAGCSVLGFSPAAPQRPTKAPAPPMTSLTYPGAPGRILISPSFRPVGSIPLVMKNGNETSHIYVQDLDGRIERLVIVRHYFMHDTAGLSENLYETFTDLIERRNTVLPTGPYQYAMYRVDGLLRHEQDFLVSKGYVVAERFLAQSLARKLPPEKGPLADVTYVIYLEDITRTDNGFSDRATRAFSIE